MARTSPSSNRGLTNTGLARNPGRNPTRGGEVMPAAAENIGKKISPAEMKRRKQATAPKGKAGASGNKGRGSNRGK
jgi:hypothetical protein